MNKSLERRLEDLEQIQGLDGPTAIFIAPGGPHRPIAGWQCGDALRVMRLPGETDAELEERAAAEASALPGPVRLIAAIP